MIRHAIDFELPRPSTDLLDSIVRAELPGRVWRLQGEFDDNGAGALRFRVYFEGVLSARITYRGAIPAELVRLAYDRVVHVLDSEWLIGLLSRESVIRVRSDLKHYVFFCDDGPLVEFAAESARIEIDVLGGGRE